MPDPWGGDRPEADKVEVLHKHLSDVWMQVRVEMAVLDAFKNETYQVWPEGVKRPAYHTPKARYLIDHAVDTQMSVDPTIKKYAAGEGDEHKKRADAVEPALTAVMLDAALKEPSIPWRQAYSYLIHYGYTVLGTLWDDTGMEKRKGESGKEYDARIIGVNPVRIKAPHPSRVLMNPFEMQPDIAIVEAQRYAGDLANLVKRKGRYGSKKIGTFEVGDNPYRQVPTIEIFTSQWHGLKLKEQSEFLVLERNPFGFMGWCHAFAGWGGEVTNAEDADPKHLAVSMLAGVKELIRRQSQKMSAVHNAVLERGFGQLGTTKNSEEAAQQLADPDAVLQGEDTDWWVLKRSDIASWVFQSLKDDDAEIEAATYVRQLTGEHQAGVTTLGQSQMYNLAASRKFYVPAKQIERMGSIVAKNICKMVTERGESITVHGLKLTPKDIDGSFDVAVTFKQVDPSVQMALDQITMAKAKGGFISKETSREAMGMENEAEEKKRLLHEMMELQPDVQEQMLINARREAGFIELADRLQEALDARIKGGVPPMPGQNGAAAMPVPSIGPQGVM